MSSSYLSEPATSGKIILHTTLGDLEIELWPKQAPKACRNFAQLCMEGYYDNTIFHRIVKGFIVQGGDPTATGAGGESIYGQPFKDEIHSRLRFTRRGLVAMASNERDSNNSQFFFTLNQTPELNGRNTIFGTVVGETIYNLVAMGEVEVDADERPLNPIKITSIEVLSLPFDDIVPRTTPAERKIQLEKERRLREEEEAKQAQHQSKKMRNKNLLSFRDEAEDEEDAELAPKKKRFKPAYDLPPEPVFDKHIETKQTQKEAVPVESLKNDVPQRKTVSDPPIEKGDKSNKPSKLSEIESQIASLKSSLKSKTSVKERNETSKASEGPSRSKVNDYLEEVAQYKSRRGKPSEDDILARLGAFKSKIWQISTKDSPSMSETDDEFVCTLHSKKGCLSCRPVEESEHEKEESVSHIFAHVLKFDKDAGVKDTFKPDDYVVLDPRKTNLNNLDNRKHISGHISGSGSRRYKE